MTELGRHSAAAWCLRNHFTVVKSPAGRAGLQQHSQRETSGQPGNTHKEGNGGTMGISFHGHTCNRYLLTQPSASICFCNTQKRLEERSRNLSWKGPGIQQKHWRTAWTHCSYQGTLSVQSWFTEYPKLKASPRTRFSISVKDNQGIWIVCDINFATK